MRVLDDPFVRVELTGREVQLLHRAVEKVETTDPGMRQEEGDLAGELRDALDEMNLPSLI